MWSDEEMMSDELFISVVAEFISSERPGFVRATL